MKLGKPLIIVGLTGRNLEVFIRLNGRRGPGTLWHVMDATLTPMGGRLLEDRLRHPWRDKELIYKHQQAVSYIHDNTEVRKTLRETLKTVYELERLSTRINLNRAYPRGYIALRKSLSTLPLVQKFHLAPTAY